MMSTGPAGRWLFAAVLSIAAVLRIAACVLWSNDLGGDPDAYRDLAERFAAGAGFVTFDGRPTAFRPPVYPLLLAAVLWAGRLGIAALHVALGVGTVALTASLGSRLRLGRLALLAALFVAIDPLLLRYTPRVMTEVTCAFLAVLVLWIASTGRQSFWLGVSFGIVALSRPTFWVFGAFVAAVWIFRRLVERRRRHEEPGDEEPGDGERGDRHSPWRVAAGLLLVAAPWGIRNAIELGRPVLTTTHGGYTLLLANNPVFWQEVVVDGAAAWEGASLHDWQQSLEGQMTDHGLETEIERDRWQRDRALEHIRDQPGLFLRSIVYRVERLWSLAPVGPEAASIPAGVRWSVGGFYLLVHLLALLGAVRLAHAAWQNRRPITSHPPAWWPLLLLIAAFVAVHAVYWTDARMRAPLVPAVALLAARGAENSKHRLRHPKQTGSPKDQNGSQSSSPA